MNERDNHTGRYASKPQSPLNETPRPKKKRPEKSRPEPERTRNRRPREEQPRSTRTERARTRAAQEDAERQRALHRRRKRRRLRRRVYRVLLAVLAVVFVLSAAMVARGLLRHDALKGTWTLDESTAYVFDGKGSGTLHLPMESYAFSYTMEANIVTLDFADETLTDASYSVLLGRDTLTLDTNTGTVYWLERER